MSKDMSPAAQRSRLDHAVQVHGLRLARCPDCKGEGCWRCEDLGELFAMEHAGRCGPDCPLGANEVA